MKKISLLLILCLLFSGCAGTESAPGGIAATTLPVYQFTSLLCQGTGIPVTRLVTENVSCLHDYSLNVSQVKAVENADLVIISGAGLESFLDDVLRGKETVDASAEIPLLESCHEEGHDGHHHEADPHIWLSPIHAMAMAKNICQGLKTRYPQHTALFEANLNALLSRLQALQKYGEQKLSSLSCRALITFHDGFSYFSESFDLHIIKALEEESGSEASAKELIELIGLVQAHNLPAVFTEENGSVAAANVICAETGAKPYTLSMAMAGSDYFAAMYHNIDTLWEALQ